MLLTSVSWRGGSWPRCSALRGDCCGGCACGGVRLLQAAPLPVLVLTVDGRSAGDRRLRRPRPRPRGRRGAQLVVLQMTRPAARHVHAADHQGDLASPVPVAAFVAPAALARRAPAPTSSTQATSPQWRPERISARPRRGDRPRVEGRGEGRRREGTVARRPDDPEGGQRRGGLHPRSRRCAGATPTGPSRRCASRSACRPPKP